MLSRQVIREANRLWDAIGTQRLDNRNGLIQAQPVSNRYEDGLRVSRLAVGNSDPLRYGEWRSTCKRTMDDTIRRPRSMLSAMRCLNRCVSQHTSTPSEWSDVLGRTLQGNDSPQNGFFPMPIVGISTSNPKEHADPK